MQAYQSLDYYRKAGTVLWETMHMVSIWVHATLKSTLKTMMVS